MSKARPGVADIGIAALEALLEPVEALERGPVREAVGHDAARGLLLQAVVADGRGGLERLLKVARLENPALFHEMAPDAREAVGLKLHLDLKGVGLLLRHALLERLNLLGNAEHGLHMVPDFVGEDVSERKVAAPAELLLHVVIEAQLKLPCLKTEDSL